MTSYNLHIIYGSFHVKSPNGFNLTVFDFDETWCICWVWSHSTKSQILGQSGEGFGRYGPSNFEIFGKKGCGHLPLTPRISGTTKSIFTKLVLMEREFNEDSRSAIILKIGTCWGTLTFDPKIWPWNSPCGSNDLDKKFHEM